MGEKRVRRTKEASDLSLREKFCLDGYLLNEQSADICYQLATGRTDEDCQLPNYHRMALRYIRLPHVQEYLQQRKAEINGKKEFSVVENKSYRTKEEVLNGLIAELPYLHGKEKADVLMKIADLQRMKQEENAMEDNTVHFFVPVTCHMCDLYNKEKQRKDEERKKGVS